MIRYVVNSAISTFAIRSLYIAGGFVSTLLLTRWLGVELLGIYNFILSWMLATVVLVKFGFEEFLVRELARNPNQVGKEIWTYCVRFVWGASFVAILIFSILIPRLSFVNPEVSLAFWPALLLIPLLGFLGVYRSAFKSQRKILESQIPEYLLRPFVIILALLGFTFFQTPPSSRIAICTNVFATTLVVLICIARSPTSKWQRGQTRRTTLARIIRESSPFILIAGIHIINQRTDRLMLGTLKDMSSVGIYSVAIQMATIVNIALLGVNAALSPVIAASKKSEQISPRLQQGIWKATNISTVVAVAILIALVLLSPWVLEQFGTDFKLSYSPMLILAFGQLTNVITGPAAVLLSMTRFEKTVSWCVGISTSTNLILNLLLIPSYGVNGAAIATGVSMIILNLLLAIMAKRLTGLSSSWLFHLVPTIESK